MKIGRKRNGENSADCTKYSYNNLNRLIKEKIADKNGNNIAVYEYTLDKKGNRIKAVENGKETS